MRSLLAALGILCLSGGWYAVAPSEEFLTVEDEPFVWQPSVEAALTFDSLRSNVGWGSFDLTAAPEHDEIRVDVLVGTPTQRSLWHTCPELNLHFDGVEASARTQWAGVRMRNSGGVYDAVTAELSIEHVRSIAYAREVRAELCGESFELTAVQRRQLRAFIENFDDMATFHGPSAPTPKPVLGPEHDFFQQAPRYRPLPA